MKKFLRNLTIIMLLFILSATFIYASGGADPKTKGLKEYTIFLGYPKEDYPVEGTILGDWIEKKTGVKLKWEFPVGDLKQKVGLLIAGGDYPDIVNCRNENRSVYDAGGFIPLDDLIEQYGPNIKKFYGNRIKMLELDDGHIYWLPQLFPYGDKVMQTGEAHGFYIQKAVLKENGWPMPKNVTEAMDMLIKYAKKYPEINGHKTYAYTALTWSWREFPLYNAGHILSGHPNDGATSVDWVNGKWVSRTFYDKIETKKIYKIYNRVFLEGLYDTESFVMDYDQYLAKLSTGSILAFYDQRWQFDKVRRLLIDQGEDRWWVGLPIVMDGYKEEFEGPLAPQVSEGTGISVNCKDPVGVIKYLDFLCSEEHNIARNWGFKDVDYTVDGDGYFRRSKEQIKKWLDLKWKNQVFGQTYWINIACFDHASVLSDGKNPINPDNSPQIFFDNLFDTEKEVLKAYGKQTWFEFFRPPDMRRAKYFPMWTIKIPTGSDIHIADEKIREVWRKWAPRLVMAEAGTYDAVWDQYIAEINTIPNRDKHAQFYQDQLDLRIEKAGGY